jgi:hypothetical protein
MATKKTSSSTKKSTAKNFVLRFHSPLRDPNPTHDNPMFYSESGQGWVADIGSATRYSESGADGIILELLKEDKIASELVDLNKKPDNLFSLNTVLLNNENNIPHIITKVPQFIGDKYEVNFNSAGRFIRKYYNEEDLVDVLKKDWITVLWDPVGSFVPEDNESWLNGLMAE